MDGFYHTTLKSYNSKETVKLYSTKLLPVRRKPLRSAFDEFICLLPKGAHVLDIGCGTGKDVGALRKRGYNAEGIDASEEMVKLARNKHGNYFFKKDFREISCFEKHAYDGISCVAVLQHIKKEDASSVFKSIRVALKKEGLFFLFTKVGEGEYWDKRLGEDYKRGTVLYTKTELDDFLRLNSFKVLSSSIFILTRDEKAEEWITIIAEAF